MTLQQLIYAISTADEKSINKTAQKFFVSHSHRKGYGKSLYDALQLELKSRGFINLYVCI